ncbi:MAG TPA: hypothetical protein VE967_14255 [Gemmatimonadaceae bacterium]|nr:hypothetical protein [Gemmatimonadaceae bacterium]
MTQSNSSASDKAWEAIKHERHRDFLLRRVAVAGWTITVVLMLLLGVLTGVQVFELARGAMAGTVPWMAVAGVSMPFVIVLGILSVLVAIVSTIGMFLRLRTASLNEIQLRLAQLEERLAHADS